MVLVVLALVAGILILDWRASSKLKARLAGGERHTDGPRIEEDRRTNYDIIQQQANSNRNQSSGGDFI